MTEPACPECKGPLDIQEHPNPDLMFFIHCPKCDLWYCEEDLHRYLHPSEYLDEDEEDEEEIPLC